MSGKLTKMQNAGYDYYNIQQFVVVSLNVLKYRILVIVTIGFQQSYVIFFGK